MDSDLSVGKFCTLSNWAQDFQDIVPTVCASIDKIHLLVTEFEFGTVSYGLSFLVGVTNPNGKKKKTRFEVNKIFNTSSGLDGVGKSQFRQTFEFSET